MIVFRCYDTLGLPALKVEIHAKCCRTGTCSSSDETAYEHVQPGEVAWGGLTNVVVDLIHRHLSEYGDETVETLLRSHLEERRTTL